MSAEQNIENLPTVPDGVGDAVGVESACWFVALVSNNTEKSVAEKLKKMGYECYVPTQKEVRIWSNGRRKLIEKVIISTIVFINCTESQRKGIVSFPFIKRFMTDKAGISSEFGQKPLAIIPDIQMQKLMFMVGNTDSPITFKPLTYKKGDAVRVIRGNLRGLEGAIERIDSHHSELIVNIDFLGSARLKIDSQDVEPLSNL